MSSSEWRDPWDATEQSRSRGHRRGIERLQRRAADPSEREFHIKVFSDAQGVTTGDGKFIIRITSRMAGMRLLAAEAYVTTVSSSGTPQVQIRNITDSVDMLSTKITIDASEFSSDTSSAPAVIDPANDDVAAGDRIAIDVDAAGTGAKGLTVVLVFGW